MHITDRSEEVIAELNSKLETALEAVGLLAEGNAQALAPVATGNLRSSITHIVDDHSVTIGTDVEYAAYVELGTSKHAEQPFLRPAVADHLQEYRDLIHETLKS